MSRLGTHSVGRLLRGELASSTDEIGSAEGRAVLKWLGLVAPRFSPHRRRRGDCDLERARMRLAAVAVLALSIRLAEARSMVSSYARRGTRHLQRRNNIPQGLVLYDASARIVVCNQPYIDMFGLSADV
jgi:PAS domain-containing protein